MRNRVVESRGMGIYNPDSRAFKWNFPRANLPGFVASS